MRTDELSAELQAALLRELVHSWRDINANFFQRALQPPVFQLVDHQSLLGRWRRRRRTIEMSRQLVLNTPWGSVIEVLKHEMAHQYVDEILTTVEESAHGAAFRDVCQRIGTDPRTTGLPTPTSEPSSERARLLKRIAGLLALAESSNLHEAKTAAAVAQRLMLKHNIALSEQPDPKQYGFKHLGKPKGRVPEAEHILAAILAEHFFVEAIWVPAFRPHDGKRGNILEICGTPENLELAAYVYDFVLGTGERLWAEHKRVTGIRYNRDRRSFISGVMEGFRERLSAEKRTCREQGLVWVGDAELHTYHRRRHPYVRQVRLQGNRRTEARAYGREAGKSIVLLRGIGDQSTEHKRTTSPALPPGALPRGNR